MLTNFVGPSILFELFASKVEELNYETTMIGVSSVAGERGRASNYAYGSAKSGFSEFLSGLRQRLSSSKAHIITVIPGYINTKMTKNMQTPKVITSSSKEVADLIFSSYISRKNIVYTRFWGIIMGLIKSIPEFIFKRLKL